jgi:transcriptional regulator with XRE-family HTH domain
VSEMPDDSDPVDDPVSRLIAELAVRRRMLGLSMGDIARRLGYTRAAVRSWETGDREIKLRTAVEYAAEVGVQVTLAPAGRQEFILLRADQVGDD